VLVGASISDMARFKRPSLLIDQPQLTPSEARDSRLKDRKLISLRAMTKETCQALVPTTPIINPLSRQAKSPRDSNSSAQKWNGSVIPITSEATKLKLLGQDRIPSIIS
jgi:hypothetical protein